MKKVLILSICMLASLSNANTNPLPIPYKLPPFPLLISDPFSNNFPVDADGIFYVTQTRFLMVGVGDYSIYGARSSFYSSTGDTSTGHFIGNVTLNDSNALFYWRDSTYKSFGMDLSNDTSFQWQFDDPNSSPTARTQDQFVTTKPLINISNFNLDIIDTNVYRNFPYAYAHPSITADSIIYILASDSLRILKKVTGTSTGISFSPTDMLTLPSSDKGGLFIIVYNVMPAIINGKKYYFQNNSTAIIGLLHVF